MHNDIVAGELYGPLQQSDDATRPVLVTTVEADEVAFTRFDGTGQPVSEEKLPIAEFLAWAGLA